MSSCAVDDTKVQQDDGTMRGVEIAPEGCHPVSTDECSSGYMAPSENVTFPENSIVKQCCKCKESEKCNLCADPDACTEEEVEKFISTDETCYGEPPPEEEEEEEEEEGGRGRGNYRYICDFYSLCSLRTSRSYFINVFLIFP